MTIRDCLASCLRYSMLREIVICKGVRSCFAGAPYAYVHFMAMQKVEKGMFVIFACKQCIVGLC